MASVAYEDEETQQQFPIGECYASDYHPNSESETDSDEEIVSLASTPVPIGRTRQGAPRPALSSQVPAPSSQAGRRPRTPRPSKQVSQVCACNNFELGGFPCPAISCTYHLSASMEDLCIFVLCMAQHISVSPNFFHRYYLDRPCLVEVPVDPFEASRSSCSLV
jgi:hypothetical protein